MATAPAFRDALKRRRCLVSAYTLSEWRKQERRNISNLSGLSSPPATLWLRRSVGTLERSAGGEWVESFSIITTDANQVVAPLHNRMPVIIERKDYARWLGGGDPAQPPLDLLRAFRQSK